MTPYRLVLVQNPLLISMCSVRKRSIRVTSLLIVNYFLTWMTIIFGGRCTKSEVKDANMVVIQVEGLPWAVKNPYGRV
jgi:hypothetical protein